MVTHWATCYGFPLVIKLLSGWAGIVGIFKKGIYISTHCIFKIEGIFVKEMLKL